MSEKGQTCQYDIRKGSNLYFSQTAKQLYLDEYNISSLYSYISACSYSDTDVSLGESRRVIDPVSYHGNLDTQLLDLLDLLHLVGW